MTIEANFDVPFIAALALREKQIQQNYRPIIGVHKWFARRPGTLFRGLLLAEFGDGPVRDSFFRSNEFVGRVVADPFMGGGTPLLEANRVGCNVLGFDINPMSAWIVREEIEPIDLVAYRACARELIEHVGNEVADLHRTRCVRCGASGVPVKYFLWVKVQDCKACGRAFDLFPGYLVAENQRHPRNVILCSCCGALNEVAERGRPGRCGECGEPLTVEGPARRGQCPCCHCGEPNAYPAGDGKPPRHRLFAIEYHCPRCKPGHDGRFFKRPEPEDLQAVDDAERRWSSTESRFVPDEVVPSGDETGRLLRWGYQRFRDLFNSRQLLGLETAARAISALKDPRLRNALATNLSDLLRYQNMLCRYDTTALKSLDIFSIHGFPVGLVQCESNFLGIATERGVNIGSGGWWNVVQKYAKAKQYCEEPFEVATRGRRRVAVPIPGERIGNPSTESSVGRRATLRCLSSTDADIPPNSLDAVLTDPPYFGNVQYGELMDFCYAWLRRLVGRESEGFDRPWTRSSDELTGNTTMDRDLEHFADGLARVFRRMAAALKPGAPLAFTFHHNLLAAYAPIGIAILDANLVCSTALPCPAEMGGSIHIHGTHSSIIDTVFVCRERKSVKDPPLDLSLAAVSQHVAGDIRQLRRAGVKPTRGDVRCVLFGQLTRMAIWSLRSKWRSARTMADKLARFREELLAVGDLDACVSTILAKHHSEKWQEEFPLLEQTDGVPL